MVSYFALNSKYVMYRREYFGGIISDVRESNFRLLNGTAADVIDLMLEGKSYSDILLELVKIYNQNVDQMESDLDIIINELLDNEYVVEVDALKSIEYNSEEIMNSRLSAPIEVNIYPYYNCNQNCNFCYVPHTYAHSSMDNCEMEKVLNSKGLENVLAYNILGGEPFLNVGLLKFLLDKAPSNKKICISTNGSYSLASDTVKWLKKYENLWIQVSLESGKREEHDSIVGLQGAYDRAILFIKSMLSENIRVSVNAVASGNNHEGILILASTLKDMGVPFMSVSLCYPRKDYAYADYMSYKVLCDKFEVLQTQLMKLATDNFEISTIKENLFVMPEERISELEKSSVPPEFLGCHGGNISVEIAPNGDVYPCGLLLEDKQYLMGNIFIEPFSNIWHSIKTNIKQMDSVDNRCLSCSARWACFSACPIVRSSTKSESFCKNHSSICK